MEISLGILEDGRFEDFTLTYFAFRDGNAFLYGKMLQFAVCHCVIPFVRDIFVNGTAILRRILLWSQFV